MIINFIGIFNGKMKYNFLTKNPEVVNLLSTFSKDQLKGKLNFYGNWQLETPNSNLEEVVNSFKQIFINFGIDETIEGFDKTITEKGEIEVIHTKRRDELLIKYKDAFKNISYEFKNSEFEPRELQKLAITFAMDKKKSYLAYEPGTGKTFIMYSIAEQIKKSNGKLDLLILSPAAYDAHNNIYQEFIDGDNPYIAEDKKKDVNIKVLNGAKKDKILESFTNETCDFNILIVSYETFRTQNWLKKISGLKNKWDGVLCDEAKVLSNIKSKQTKAITSFIKNKKPEFLTFLEGTPIRRFADGLYVPLHLLEGTDEWGNYFSFIKEYCRIVPIKVKKRGYELSIDKIVGSKNMLDLNRRMSSCFLTCSLDDMKDVPKFVISKLRYDLSPKHKAFLDDIKENFLGWLKEFTGNNRAPAEEDRLQVLRLQQAITIPESLGFDGEPQYKKILSDYVDNLIEQDKKIVIFTKFRQTAFDIEELLLKKLKKEEIINYIEDGLDKTEAKARFQRDGSPVKIFLTTIASGGASLTLHKSHNLIFVELPDTWLEFFQSLSRIYRTGQTKKANIVVLQANKTLQQKMFSRLMLQKKEAEQIFRGELDESKSQTMTAEDFKEMLAKN